MIISNNDYSNHHLEEFIEHFPIADRFERNVDDM